MNETVQSILEKVKSAAEQAGQLAGQTLDQAKSIVNEIVDISKMNGQIRELEQKCESIMTSLGAIVYAAYLDPATDTEEIDELLCRLKTHKDDIAALKAAIDERKQIKSCPGCDNTVDKDDVFCRFCGKAL